MDATSSHDRSPSETSASESTAGFTVYETEPLMRILTSTRWSNPVTLIVAFFLVVTIPLFVWSAIREAPQATGYISFFRALSWSVSMVFVWPFVIGLTLDYYRRIPRLVRYLTREIAEDAEGSQVDDFTHWLERRFNAKIVPPVVLVVALIVGALWVVHELNGKEVFWGSNGGLFQAWLGTAHGLSWIGVYAVIIAVVLTYWVLNVGWRGFVLAWGLFEFFNRRNFTIRLEPLHPDGACGLRPIGDVSARQNLILFLVGMQLSLVVIDKMVVQESEFFQDMANVIMLGAYAVGAPLLFFLPLGSAHHRMLDTRNRFLRPISRACQEAVTRVTAADLDEGRAKFIESLSSLERLRDDLKKKIPVWPFNFRTVQAFFGTIVVPLLPLLLPVVIQLAIIRK